MYFVMILQLHPLLKSILWNSDDDYCPAELPPHHRWKYHNTKYRKISQHYISSQYKWRIKRNKKYSNTKMTGWLPWVPWQLEIQRFVSSWNKIKERKRRGLTLSIFRIRYFTNKQISFEHHATICAKHKIGKLLIFREIDTRCRKSKSGTVNGPWKSFRTELL